MINSVERLSSDIHDARAEFLLSAHRFEDTLTPEGLDTLDDIKRGLANLISALEDVLIRNGE